MKYLATINKVGNYYKVILLDFDNLSVERYEKNIAIQAAKVLLVAFLERTVIKGNALIYPVVKTDIKTLSNVINSKDLISINIDPDVWVKLLLLDTFNKSKLIKTELASKADISLRKLEGAFNIRTKVDLNLTNKLFKILGKQLKLGIE